MSTLSATRKTLAYYLTWPAVRLLARTGITPNAVTWVGFLVTAGAAALIVIGHFFAAGFVVLVAGFFDVLDGALARGTNRSTQFGAVLDATLDRLAEAVLLLAIVSFSVLNASERSGIVVLLATITMVGSFLVSYIRARAEALGVECQVGLFTRAERVAVLALGLLLNQILIALAIIALFSFITVGQRLVCVWQQTREGSS